ncbi:hypothetical protein PROFUN_07206 [Planoprotostelium fungivorum]|uniref:Uncharacterized protein n=2 Tax=Planoprotostelium fungivorum TaxID=1890364 RepID=A0A2P6NME1_9EUKA|nr:hypothetical protein PROFUN_07206 [Planoprotostelium fungivorum]
MKLLGGTQWESGQGIYADDPPALLINVTIRHSIHSGHIISLDLYVLTLDQKHRQRDTEDGLGIVHGSKDHLCCTKDLLDRGTCHTLGRAVYNSSLVIYSWHASWHINLTLDSSDYLSINDTASLHHSIDITNTDYYETYLVACHDETGIDGTLSLEGQIAMRSVYGYLAGEDAPFIAVHSFLLAFYICSIALFVYFFRQSHLPLKSSVCITIIIVFTSAIMEHILGIALFKEQNSTGHYRLLESTRGWFYFFIMAESAGMAVLMAFTYFSLFSLSISNLWTSKDSVSEQKITVRRDVRILISIVLLCVFCIGFYLWQHERAQHAGGNVLAATAAMWILPALVYIAIILGLTWLEYLKRSQSERNRGMFIFAWSLLSLAAISTLLLFIALFIYGDLSLWKTNFLWTPFLRGFHLIYLIVIVSVLPHMRNVNVVSETPATGGEYSQLREEEEVGDSTTYGTNNEERYPL